MPGIPPDSGSPVNPSPPGGLGHLESLLAEKNAELAERTRELRAAQEKLQRTNSKLLHLTLELEDRVAERTQELAGANAALSEEIHRRQTVEDALRRRSSCLSCPSH